MLCTSNDGFISELEFNNIEKIVPCYESTKYLAHVLGYNLENQ